MPISEQAFPDKPAPRFDARFRRKNPLLSGVKLKEFDDNKPVGDWPFFELVGGLMWLAN